MSSFCEFILWVNLRMWDLPCFARVPEGIIGWRPRGSAHPRIARANADTLRSNECFWWKLNCQTYVSYGISEVFHLKDLGLQNPFSEVSDFPFWFEQGILFSELFKIKKKNSSRGNERTYTHTKGKISTQHTASSVRTVCFDPDSNFTGGPKCRIMQNNR